MLKNLAELLHEAATQGGDDGVTKPYLTRRGNSWQFRLRVPKKYRAALGKTEIVKSFGAVSQADANRLWLLELTRAHDEFEKLERIGSGRTDLSSLDVGEISRIARLYFSALEDHASSSDVPFDERERSLLISSNIEDLNALGQLDAVADSSVQQFAKAAARRAGIDPETLEGDAFARLTEAVHAGLIEHHLRHQDRLELSPAKQRDGRFSADQLKQASNTGGTKLSLVIDRWEAERAPTRKTRQKMDVVVSAFLEVRQQIRLESITVDDVQIFKDWLIANEKSLATAQNKFSQLKTLLKFARDSRLIPTAPGDGMSIRSKLPRRPRTAFGIVGLRALFSSTIYTTGERPVGGGGDASYWLPLISLYSGARQREIAQLRPSDIEVEDYFDSERGVQKSWVMRFRHDPAVGQRLKTPSSERRVPIHRALLERGFLDLVRAARDRGDERVFGDLTPDNQGNPAGNYSKWFGRHLRNVVKIGDQRITFHSLRHTFKHCCRELRIADDVQRQLMGHSSGDVGEGYGADEFPLGPLVEAINTYSVPGFDPPPAPKPRV